MGYARRVQIIRNYEHPMGQMEYDVRISRNPLNDLEPFHSNVFTHDASHTHDVLFALLTEGLGSEESARSALKEAMAGRGPVEVRLLESTPLSVIEKLAVSSATS